MKILIHGEIINVAQDFHRIFASALGIERFYGGNLHALWDVLSASIERPVVLIWENSEKSRKILGEDFEAIIDVFKRVEVQDEKFGWAEKFSFVLV